MEAWQINLSLIPSIAVVLNSVNRVTLGLTDEINLWVLNDLESYSEVLAEKLMQLKRLSRVIFLMYISLIILIVNALLAGLKIIPEDKDKWLIFISILILLVSIFYKILYSFHAYFIRQKQFRKYCKTK